MKKCLSALLALCLICASFALAEGTDNTIVGSYSSPSGGTTSRLTYTIPRRENYVVTIPASLNLDVKAGSDFSGTMQIALTDTDFSSLGYTLSISLTEAGFALKNGKYSIPYSISYLNASVSVGDKVLEWKNSPETASTASSVLTISGTAPKVLGDGEYSDSLTFAVSVQHPLDGAR